MSEFDYIERYNRVRNNLFGGSASIQQTRELCEIIEFQIRENETLRGVIGRKNETIEKTNKLLQKEYKLQGKIFALLNGDEE
jgi:hypothetical protein